MSPSKAVTRKPAARTAGKRAEPQLRADLVEAALRLFTLYGYQSVTVADIGAEANVSGPALYRYFSNKEALLAEALYLSADRTIEDAKRIVSEAPSPEVALERLVRSWARSAVSDKSRLVIGYFQESQHLPPDARKKLGQRYVTYVNLAVEVLAQVRPEMKQQERMLRLQAAMGMIASSPYFVSDAHEATLTETLTELSMKILL